MAKKQEKGNGTNCETRSRIRERVSLDTARVYRFTADTMSIMGRRISSFIPGTESIRWEGG